MRLGGENPPLQLDCAVVVNFQGQLKHATRKPVNDEKGQDSRRLLWLELQALARALLSGRSAAEAVVRVLRRGFRHGRDQQHLLSTTRHANLQGMARTGAGRIHIRGQGESVPDSPEKTERYE